MVWFRAEVPRDGSIITCHSCNFKDTKAAEKKHKLLALTFGGTEFTAARTAEAALNGSCCNPLKEVHIPDEVCFHFGVVKYL